jgi:hypothetical protein
MNDVGLALLVIAAYLIALLVLMVAFFAYECLDMRKQWQRLGRKEALAGKGQQNVPTGMARNAYLRGYEGVLLGESQMEPE